MICLDTNYLIRALIPGTRDAAHVEAWIGAGENIILPTVAWYEFLCGCTKEEEHLALALLTGGLQPFGDAEARVSAHSFRSIRTPRHLRVDAMIAGTAIAADALLATNNRADFRPFVAHGLRLA
ncbi:MAG: type II toxin-antitoxin system VapC family toxin [Verrucomicrobia bacterium]|nr:type II toxin-antitoxin system VapC family toxin [Verrucomicrobiota bacterium]